MRYDCSSLIASSISAFPQMRTINKAPKRDNKAQRDISSERRSPQQQRLTASAGGALIVMILGTMLILHQRSTFFCYLQKKAKERRDGRRLKKKGHHPGKSRATFQLFSLQSFQERGYLLPFRLALFSHVSENGSRGFLLRDQV